MNRHLLAPCLATALCASSAFAQAADAAPPALHAAQ